MSICRVLSVTQEHECRAVLKLVIALGDCWYLVPVGIFTGDLLEIDLALPTVVTAKCGRYLQALMHYKRLVALNGPGVLQLVYKVREHEDRKVSSMPSRRLSAGSGVFRRNRYSYGRSSSW